MTYKSIKDYMKSNNLSYAKFVDKNGKKMDVVQSTIFCWATKGIPIDPLERFGEVAERLSISPADLRPDVADAFKIRMKGKYKSIDEYMKDNGLVFANMGKPFGVDQSTVFRWDKNGITVDPLERFMKVSKRLSISPRDLRPDVYDMFKKGK
ncbi:MAG: hypothetical protein GY941_11475 [Planctomycetes bacterium]|nr:hypothetical protein [Planctomycetota bacterium]